MVELRPPYFRSEGRPWTALLLVSSNAGHTPFAMVSDNAFAGGYAPTAIPSVKQYQAYFSQHDRTRASSSASPALSNQMSRKEPERSSLTPSSVAFIVTTAGRPRQAGL